ncbi:MAG TPA: DUF3090 family protein [Ktedonobacterales bacterium]|nr:DUF3090 family protein [Ktedonobacterales bacterium]
MSDDLSEIGRAELLDADAVGEPGARRFRLFGRRGPVTAIMWLEREHIEQLSLAVDQLLARITRGKALHPEALAAVSPPPGPPASFPREPDLEFQVASLQLGYDEERRLILLRAAPIELVEEDGEMVVRDDVEPLFSAFITPTQAVRLSEHMTAVLATGRPRCPYCGRAMDTPHLCAKQNGYHPVNVN